MEDLSIDLVVWEIGLWYDRIESARLRCPIFTFLDISRSDTGVAFLSRSRDTSCKAHQGKCQGVIRLGTHTQKLDMILNAMRAPPGASIPM